MELTENEKYIKYEILDKQCERICPSGEVTHRLFKSILSVCCIFSLVPKLSDKFQPDEAVEILDSLIKKGFVFSFCEPDSQMDCFVPMGWEKIKETTVKYVEPSHIYKHK